MSTTSFAVKVLAAAYGVPAPVGGKPPPERTSLVQIEAELARLRRIEHTRLGHQGALFDQLIELAGRLRDQNGAAVAGVLDPQKALAGALVRKYAAGIESGEVLE